MEDLVRWYRQQLDEEQGIARACAGNGEWTANDIKVYGPDLSVAVRAHMAEHDPARVLREIDSKRQTLVELEAAEQAMDQASRDGDTARYNAMRAEWVVLRRIVRRDVAVYADRPGYQESWRP